MTERNYNEFVLPEALKTEIYLSESHYICFRQYDMEQCEHITVALTVDQALKARDHMKSLIELALEQAK